MGEYVDKVKPLTLDDIHPEVFFGKNWMEYATRIKDAKTRDDLFSIFMEIRQKHGVTMGDAADDKKRKSTR